MAMSDEERIGRGIVEAVIALRGYVLEARELMATCARSAPYDTTAIVGFMVRRLRAVAASRLPDGNPHKLRWPFEERPLEDPRGLRGALQIADFLLAAMALSGDDQVLADVDALWPECATKAEADRRQRELHGERDREKARIDERAHAERLAAKKPAGPRRPAATVPAPAPAPAFEGVFDLGETPDASDDLRHLQGFEDFRVG
jgi:hypothetical protein